MKTEGAPHFVMKDVFSLSGHISKSDCNPRQDRSRRLFLALPFDLLINRYGVTGNRPSDKLCSSLGSWHTSWPFLLSSGSVGSSLSTSDRLLTLWSRSLCNLVLSLQRPFWLFCSFCLTGEPWREMESGILPCLGRFLWRLLASSWSCPRISRCIPQFYRD